MGFQEFLSNCDLSENTFKDYTGQYQKICSLLNTSNLDTLIFSDLTLVLDSLKNKNLGLSSYKKKLDVIKKVLNYLEVTTTANFYNAFLKMSLDAHGEKYIEKCKEQTKCYSILSNNYILINKNLKQAWENIKCKENTNIGKNHTLQQLKKLWAPHFNKAKKLISSMDPYDLVEKLNTVHGVKYRRNKLLIYIERCILYGLYINYDTDDFKKLPNRDFYTDFKITDVHYKHPSTIYRNDLKPIFAQWKKIRKKLNFVSDDKVFFESNIGFALKQWSINNLFGSDKKKGTSITDIAYIYKHNNVDTDTVEI